MLPSGPGRKRARSAVRASGSRNSVIDALRRDAADLPAGELAEPDVAVAAERRRARLAVRRRDVELGDDPGGRDAAHPVAEVLREPEVAVGPDRDDSRRAAGMRQREFDEPRCRPAPCGRCGCRALSVNQSVPSGAIEIVVGPLPGFGSGNSVNAPVAAGADRARDSREHAPWQTIAKQNNALRTKATTGADGLTRHSDVLEFAQH